MARFFVCFILLLASFFLHAQADTTRVLETVTITASRFRQFPIAQQITTLDSTRLQTVPSLSLAELLQQNTGIFIKSYGLGSLATLSVRGASAAHTAVIWNGFPIQSPMLGQLDLALLPVSFTDEVQIQLGGNSALWGSGAVGGVLQLNNKLPFYSGWQLRLNSQVGSFSQWHNDLKISFGNQKFVNSTRLLYQTAKNDFPYHITPDAPRQIQQNAGFQQTGILQENRILLKPNQFLSFRVWITQAEQEIPPTTTQNFSVAKQDNQFFRTTLDWQVFHKQWVVQVRTGVFRDFIHYQDSIAGVDAPSHSWTSISEAEAEWNRHPLHRFYFGIHHTTAYGEADGYPEGHQQQQSAFFAAYHFQNQDNTYRTRVSLRQGFANGAFLPWIPSFAIEYDLTKWFLIKSNVTRNFRLPTLNDLYWQPGGNVNLKPENGWAEELTLQTHWEKANYEFTYALTGFNRKVDDWILWVPGAAFWSPQNISKVWSRGLEQRISWKLAVKDWKVELNGGYDWIRSTQEQASTEANLNKQLIYVPKQQAFGRLAMYYKTFLFSYQHHYTGSVFTRSDNLAALPDYQLGALQLRYGHSFRAFKSNIYLQINNLWNKEYRIIERRRMPGTNFQLGVSFHFL